MNITVYSKPSCQQCKLTCLSLDHAGIPYDVVDLTTNSAALEYVQDLGYSQAPVSSSWTTTTTGQDSTPPKSNGSSKRSNNHPPAGDPVPHENLMPHSPARWG